jgi:Holliday junction resolvase RusA-like endonuclease
MIKVAIKPLSINEAYQGYRRRTPKYNSYISSVFFLLPNDIIVPESNIKLKIEFGFSSLASDIDNCCKPFIDILQKKYEFNDKNIIELFVSKTKVSKGFEYILFKFY